MAAVPQVSVSAKRWIKECNSHSLFNFEASDRDVETRSFVTEEVMSMLGSNGRQLLEGRSCQPMVQWRPARQGLEVAPVKLDSSSTPFLIVKELGKQSRQLQEGDVIQLGTELLHVRQLSMQDAAIGQTCAECEESSNGQCRICLEKGCSVEDPFVQPCTCSGSVARVHLGCLRQWAHTKQNLPREHAQRYTFQKPTCEMCKAAYSSRVVHSGVVESLLQLPPAQGPFLLLESAGKGAKTDGLQRQGALHVLSFAGSEVASIGRSRDCSIVLKEVSVSRWHASIRFEDGCFCVEDHNSKFGTFLSMRGSQSLLLGEALLLKMGELVLSITLVQSSRWKEESIDLECGSMCLNAALGKA